MVKPVYIPTVAERVLPADRDTAWRALVDLVGVGAVGDTRPRALGGIPVTETAISVEPPWRLVLDARGGPTAFHQESIVLVPDAAGCLAMWSALVLEPDDDATTAYLNAVAGQVEPQLDQLSRRLSP